MVLAGSGGDQLLLLLRELVYASLLVLETLKLSHDVLQVGGFHSLFLVLLPELLLVLPSFDLVELTVQLGIRDLSVGVSNHYWVQMSSTGVPALAGFFSLDSLVLGQLLKSISLSRVTVGDCRMSELSKLQLGDDGLLCLCSPRRNRG